jgi:hypothetical protein
MLIPYAQNFMYFHYQDQGGVGVNSGSHDIDLVSRILYTQLVPCYIDSIRAEIDVLPLPRQRRSWRQSLRVMMLIPYAQKLMYFHYQDQSIGVNILIVFRFWSVTETEAESMSIPRSHDVDSVRIQIVICSTSQVHPRPIARRRTCSAEGSALR